MDRGAKVTHASDIEQAHGGAAQRAAAPTSCCATSRVDIGRLVRALATERICTPVVACGIGTDARRAVDAIRAGAKEYLPLPPDPELIAAVLAAVADESPSADLSKTRRWRAVIALADQVAGSDASILITGESGTGKEVLARYVHRKSRARRQAVHLGQLRRDPGEPARIRIVRPREGRVHRRHRAAHRQVRGSQWRHAAARRNQRDGCAPAGQTAARHSGARDRPRRRHQAGQGRHPHHRDLEPRSRRGGDARHVPRRSALSPERRESAPARAARAAEGHSGARPPLRAQICRGQRRAVPPDRAARPSAC